MTVEMTKAAINKLLVEERMKMRSKQRNSAFMRRTLSIYNGQQKRMREHTGDLKAKLPFTLHDFRCAVESALRNPCCYCGGKLSIKTVTPDHATSIAAGGGWAIGNLVWCDQSCNWQKGRLSSTEFRRLVLFMNKYLSPESATDVRRRLTIGGKWSQR